MRHLLLRFGLHFIAASFIVLASSAVLWSVWRRLDWHIRSSKQYLAFLVIVAIPSAALPALREVFDVAAGQSLLKAVSDYVSWFSGATFSCWLLYRLRRGGF